MNVTPESVGQDPRSPLEAVLRGLNALQKQLATTLQLPPDMPERIKRGLTAWREILGLMAPRGWVVPLNYTPREVADLLSVYHHEGPEAVERRLLGDFRAETAQRAVARMGQPKLPVWKPKLELAAAAHDRGEYALAIPIWLIASEGTVRAHIDNINPYGLQSSGGRDAKKIRAGLADHGEIAP